MRIASGIISIFLGLIVLLQSCAVNVGGIAFGEKSAQEGGSVGILVALLFVVGGAFAFGLPKVTMIITGIAGVLGIAAGTTTVFKDMTIWGVVALILTAMNWFAARKPKEPPVNKNV
ncbi:MAG: hypothetical protein L5656_08430 [Thermanaeromonas sp.]|uniref:hypothetical protein n=1 Tax=Thermanaeromonas sp. TaxID=2003697 RepID=UPI00243E74DC|nr:hypothetical protein [Thermanaeromonas sp.]MCG0278538.1 hypothetical protein [Thermanaeromonas sp.]